MVLKVFDILNYKISFLLFLLESLAYCFWMLQLFLLVLALETSKLSLTQSSSLPRYCWIIHNSSELRILSLVVFLQKIHNHLQLLDALCKLNPINFFLKMMKLSNYRIHNSLHAQTIPTSLHLTKGLPKVSHIKVQYQGYQLVWQSH